MGGRSRAVRRRRLLSEGCTGGGGRRRAISGRRWRCAGRCGRGPGASPAGRWGASRFVARRRSVDRFLEKPIVGPRTEREMLSWFWRGEEDIRGKEGRGGRAEGSGRSRTALSREERGRGGKFGDDAIWWCGAVRCGRGGRVSAGGQLQSVGAGGRALTACRIGGGAGAGVERGPSFEKKGEECPRRR